MSKTLAKILNIIMFVALLSFGSAKKPLKPARAPVAPMKFKVAQGISDCSNPRTYFPINPKTPFETWKISFDIQCRISETGLRVPSHKIQLDTCLNKGGLFVDASKTQWKDCVLNGNTESTITLTCRNYRFQSNLAQFTINVFDFVKFDPVAKKLACK